MTAGVYTADTTPIAAVALAGAAPLLVAHTTQGHGTGGKRTTMCPWNTPNWSFTPVGPATTSQSVLPFRASSPHSCSETDAEAGKLVPVTVTLWPTVAAASDTVTVGAG